MLRTLFGSLDLRKPKILGLIFGGIATIAQIISLPAYIVSMVFGASAITIIYAIYLKYQREPLPKIPTYHTGVYTKNIESLAEFSEIDTLYQSCFGDASIPSGILKSWWQKYPKGLIGLFEDNKLIGGVSIWTVDDATFDALKKGHLKEKDISSDNLDLLTKEKWYISEIAISSKKRNLTNLQTLIDKTLEQLEEEISNLFPSQVLAMGYSNQGVSLMQTLGFVQELNPSQTLDHMPLFRMNVINASKIGEMRKTFKDLLDRQKANTKSITP